MKQFDIAPFALPNGAPGELRFEELRDIARGEVAFAVKAPARVGLSYLKRYWPERRVEQSDPSNPASFGWIPTDDWFNGTWQRAAVDLRKLSDRKVAITFKPLTREFADQKDYAVRFRRTVGIRIDAPEAAAVKSVAVYTTSAPARTKIRVRLDCGRRTKGKILQLSAYNAVPGGVAEPKGITVRNRELRLGSARNRSFQLAVTHMASAHPYANDDGHVTFSFDGRTFTISLSALAKQGPIWFSEMGVFITKADDPTDFAAYRAANRSGRTILQRVLERPEQSYGGAYFGQPRPHPTGYCLGCKHARQRFRIEPNGDIVLDKRALTWAKGKDTDRFKNAGQGRFFFGLERWCVTGRFNDPSPVPVYNIHLKRGTILLEQKSLAVPLEQSILDGEPACDDTIVALVRFRFHNAGDRTETAELRVGYSDNSHRSANPLLGGGQNDRLVPLSPHEPLKADNGRITGAWQSQPVLRATCQSTMQLSAREPDLLFTQELQPGQDCELLLKIPYIAADSDRELAALHALDVERSLDELTRFWREESRRGAQLNTPEPNLDALHAAHLTHVQIADPSMPDDRDLVNTSVGTSTYGNFSNESCMIIQELDQRGLHEEARRRLDLYVKYQGTVKLPGNFTDCDGVFFGAGGFEAGNYNQHHGWVLWCLAEHYFHSRDRAWLERIAAALIAGADWVFRQRRNTMTQLRHSRGWEYGFLPAGSLEDVTDFWYWLSTNALTWRGTDATARALEAIDHPDAGRVRRESDAYRTDLIRGFETMRQHSPLVRLRDGRWVPHYPSRLYCRGRDVGWIRETLEGSVYLLISGLYDPTSRAAGWILEDFQDNRYMSPPFGYHVPPPASNWYDHGGISIQPCLLAGLMPHLERDEPELFLWMFFNAFCSVYREETNSMVEHPVPTLGYSNSAYVKTSDEANATMWLRYMYVYATPHVLHFGRAIPREWFSDGNELEAAGVSTRFGRVSVRYESSANSGRIAAVLDLSLVEAPPRLLVRFRHPQKAAMRAAAVNGKPTRKFDPTKGDVDITGLGGKVTIEASF